MARLTAASSRSGVVSPWPARDAVGADEGDVDAEVGRAPRRSRSPTAAWVMRADPAAEQVQVDAGAGRRAGRRSGPALVTTVSSAVAGEQRGEPAGGGARRRAGRWRRRRAAGRAAAAAIAVLLVGVGAVALAERRPRATVQRVGRDGAAVHPAHQAQAARGRTRSRRTVSVVTSYGLRPARSTDSRPRCGDQLRRSPAGAPRRTCAPPVVVRSMRSESVYVLFYARMC